VGISRTRGLLYSPWQPLGIPSAITLLGQLYKSPPSPIPGDIGRGPSQKSTSFFLSCLNIETRFCLSFFLWFLFFPFFFLKVSHKKRSTLEGKKRFDAGLYKPLTPQGPGGSSFKFWVSWLGIFFFLSFFPCFLGSEYPT